MPDVPPVATQVAQLLRAPVCMSLSLEIRRRREEFRIPHEPTCDRCGHGASLHTLADSVPCIGCGERTAAGLAGRPVCIGFTSAWFDNSHLQTARH